MVRFTDVINTVVAKDEDYHAIVPEDWQQGRTTYGGLSAALCLAVALRAAPDAPPLRAAQFTFVGPAAGAIRLSPHILRAGKNSLFMGVDLFGEAGLATRATLSFAAARPSELAYLALPAPDVAPPGAEGHLFPRDAGPRFAHHFDMRAAGGGGALISGAASPDLLVWARHRQAEARHGLIALLALADSLPPSALTMFTRPAPISTVTWSIEVIDPALAAAGEGDGWYLLHSRGDHVAQGYCGQHMTVWNHAGAPILAGRQTIAIFL